MIRGKIQAVRCSNFLTRSGPGHWTVIYDDSLTLNTLNQKQEKMELISKVTETFSASGGTSNYTKYTFGINSGALIQGQAPPYG